MRIIGPEFIESVEKKFTAGNNGKPVREYAVIHFTNGLQAATFHKSVIEAAQAALVSKLPLMFVGTVRPHKHNERVYPNFVIDEAPKLDEPPATADEDDLPF